MTEPTEFPNPDIRDESSGATQLGILLTAASDLIDEQFKVSERLDAKSRNQVTIAATVFAGVQAGVISLLNGILGPDRAADIARSDYVPYLAGAACIGAAALLIAVIGSYQAWRLRPEKTLSIKTINSYVEAARSGNPAVGVNLIQAYTQIAKIRGQNNASRAETLERAGWACVLTLIVVGIELIMAFFAVIYR